MKFFSILLSLASLSVSAQNSQWLWPIEGAKTGDNIVCRPQDRIDKELNTGNLFIAAPEGTTVVAPVDGTIGALYVVANTSLKQSVTYGMVMMAARSISRARSWLTTKNCRWV